MFLYAIYASFYVSSALPAKSQVQCYQEVRRGWLTASAENKEQKLRRRREQKGEDEWKEGRGAETKTEVEDRYL